MFTTAQKWLSAHRFIAIAGALILIAGGWWTYHKLTTTAAQPQYMLGTVERGTVISSVSASGQVSASNQVDVKSKVSGNLTYLNAKPGQKVGAGTSLAYVDATDAQKTLRDAKVNLENAQISLEKLKAPASALTITQAENALAQAKESKDTATDNLAKAYLDGYDDMVNAFLDLPDMMTAFEKLLIGTNASGGSQWNMDYYLNATLAYDENATQYKNDAYDSYLAAKAAYNTAYASYQKVSRTSDSATIEASLNDTYTMLQAIGKAVRSNSSFIQFYSSTMELHNHTPVAAATAAQATLNTDSGTVNGHLSTVLADVTAIKNDKQSIVTATRSIAEKEQSLAETREPADELDLRSAQLTLTQRQDAVTDAENNLANYSIRAPFGGTIATVAAKPYDSVSNGTAIATLVTDAKIATLSLNEVDATKVHIGDKVTLTFDAIEELSLTGKVAEIDTLGTVSQGVVSYAIKIAFDAQDARIKPGMTVNAAIITEVKQDVLTVPASAVKTRSGVSYVEAFEPALAASARAQSVTSAAAPTQVEVELGIAGDTNVEIVSGLTEGQQIVMRTISASAAANTTAAAPAARGGGGFGGGIRL